MKPKHQRLVLLLLAVAAIGGAALLALSALKEQATYFYSPSDVAKDGVPPGQAIRLGGMVAKGSLNRAPDGITYRFVVTDNARTVPVVFKGIPPDLFKEDSGVVCEGSFDRAGVFVADNLLAKHDERYMPPQVAGAMHKAKSLK